jgi:hypothetical protein
VNQGKKCIKRKEKNKMRKITKQGKERRLERSRSLIDEVEKQEIQNKGKKSRYKQESERK